MNNNKLNNSIDELKQQINNLIILKDQIKDFNGNEFDKLISTSKDLTKNIIDFIKKCQNNNSTQQQESVKKNKQQKASVRNRTMKRNTRNANKYEIFSDFSEIKEDLYAIDDFYTRYQRTFGKNCDTDRYTERDCEKALRSIEQTPGHINFIKLYRNQIFEKDNIISTFKTFLRSLGFRYSNGLIPQLEIIDKRLNPNRQKSLRRGGNKKRYKKKKHTKRYKKKHNKKRYTKKNK